MDNRRNVAREISRIYCPMTPLGIDMLGSILVPMKFQKGETCDYRWVSAQELLAMSESELVGWQMKKFVV